MSRVQLGRGDAQASETTRQENDLRAKESKLEDVPGLVTAAAKSLMWDVTAHH